MTVEKILNKDEKKEHDKRKHAPYNAYNLVPCMKDGYEDYEEAEYHYNLLCLHASKGDPVEAERLYEEGTLEKVYKRIMVQRAYNW